MDFYTLTRKQLQALCKKNKIPANITNVAMADALAALDQVEGLDEILNPGEADIGTPNVKLRTAGRASTQRKAARPEAEGSAVKVSASARPLRGARVGVASGVTEQENKDANVPPVTPAAARRRATAVSTRREKEVEIVEDDGDKNVAPKTVAAASVGRRRATSRSVCTTKNETPGGTSVQRTYSTRRSVRLLENGLSKMSLINPEDTVIVKIDDDDDDVSQELSYVSHQVEDSFNTEKGSSLQMDSTVVSEDTREFEVSSSEQNTGYECQSHESASDVKLSSATEIDTVVGPHGSDEGEPEKINSLGLGSEQNESDEAGSDPSLDLEETCDSSDLKTENKECVGACQESFPVEASADAITEVTGPEIVDMVPDNVSVDVTDQGVAGSFSMTTDCKMYNQVSNGCGNQISNQCGDQVSNDQDISNGALGSQKEQVEIMDEKISHEGDDEEDKNNELEVEDESDYSSVLEGSSDSCDRCDGQASEVLPVREDSTVATLDVLPSETSEAQVEVTYQDTASLTVVVVDEDVVASIPISPVSDAPTVVNETIEYNTSDVKQDAKDETIEYNTSDVKQDARDETIEYNTSDVNQDVKDEIIEYNTSDVNQDVKDETTEYNTSDMTDEECQHLFTVDDKDAKESGSMIGSEVAPELDAISSSAGELQAEELKEIKPDQMEAGTDSAPVVTEAQAEESEELVTGQVSVESASSPIDGEVVSEEVSAIRDQETVIVSSEHVSSEAPVQSVVSDPSKENAEDLFKKTLGELRRRLKNFKIDEKSNCNKTTNKEGDKKRSALQALPQNRMTSGEAQIDD